MRRGDQDKIWLYVKSWGPPSLYMQVKAFSRIFQSWNFQKKKGFIIYCYVADITEKQSIAFGMHRPSQVFGVMKRNINMSWFCQHVPDIVCHLVNSSKVEEMIDEHLLQLRGRLEGLVWLEYSYLHKFWAVLNWNFTFKQCI